MEKIKFIKMNGKLIVDATHKEIVEKLNELVEGYNNIREETTYLYGWFRGENR